MYRVTGEVRLQDDGNQVHQRNEAVGGLCTTSFEEQVDLQSQAPSLGAGLTLSSPQPQGRPPTWEGQHLPVRLFLVHHLHFMGGRKGKGRKYIRG